MSDERFVVLGLAHVRSSWFREVSRWSTSAAVPIDFVKCVSIDELRARLRSGRAFSAVLADMGVAGIDRDLVDLAREIGAAVILVGDGVRRAGAAELGVSAVLPTPFERGALLAALDEHASLIGSSAPETAGPVPAAAHATGGWRGRVVAVTGAGGTGTSVTAMAIAQGLAADVRAQGRVLLADLALDADQAMLHDARDIVPGVQELVDAFRHGTPSTDEVIGLTFGEGHPYRLLLGLRRHRDWTALRPRAWTAALDGLRRSFTQIVADIDPDLEGEAECGSVDVEDRNLLARSVLDVAEIVVVTAHPGVQGIHRLVRTLAAVQGYGVDPARVLPVIHRAPRNGRARAELTHTVAALVGPLVGPAADRLASPVFIPEHRRLDASLRDGAGVPPAMAATLAAAVTAVMDHVRYQPKTERGDTEPVAVVPGSLGAWSTSQEATG